ncbi:MAG: hypothetical protein Q9159_000675 [Coniocarpon cinnabarinum]
MELENAVRLVDSNRDGLYRHDADAQKKINEAKPWRKDPNHFKHVRISAVALIKMVMHARTGGQLEVMGLMQGYVAGDSIIVTDAFRLPVEGTETRVNAQDEANEYMVNFLVRARESGQMENAVGWYHSHPGYGCWLSGIDVTTQHTQQMFQDPFCAVVIDPDRTISAGKVEIGGFRTYPDDYKKEEGADAETDAEGFQTIPLAKMEDFGAHSARYYSLEVSHFKSTLDSQLLEALWNKYWVSTVSSSPLFTNRDYGTKQIAELGLKIKQAERAAAHGSRGGPMIRPGASSHARDAQLEKIVMAGNKIQAEEEAGLMAAEIKEKLFNRVGQSALTGEMQKESPALAQ